jgi:ribonuclease HII
MLEHVCDAIGVDEAGRGPLAGPVVVAAVILPDAFDLTGLNDSKKVAPARRTALEERIKSEAKWHIELAGPDEIDRLNILWATMAAMERAVAAISSEGEIVLIDGDRVPRGLSSRGRAVIKGDGKIACIAAASILAKTHRDRLMVEMALIYPQYGFENHFGYPTPEHLEALRVHGPCAIHRRSFAPLRVEVQPCLDFGE